MGDSPRYPEPEDEADRGAPGGTGGRLTMLGGILMIVLAMALVVLIVLLHLTGTLGPGTH
jgi:hypothetical protein